jgi:hypothetical protein
METFTETIRLGPGVHLRVSPTKFRLYRLFPWDVAPWPEALQEIGDIHVMRQMMAGAFCAGFPQNLSNSAINAAAAAPSLLRHIFSLAGSYQTTRATPPTMRRVAKRLAARGQHAAAAHCLNVAEEEAGHDELALMDLAALGLPAQAFVADLQPKSALALVELFSRLADSDTPIAVLGYAYALERLALFWTEDAIVAIEQLIPGGITATRCLRVHSAVGSDAEHVAESTIFMATLSPKDRAAAARAAYETVSLLCGMGSDYPGDETMRELLAKFGVRAAPASFAENSPDTLLPGGSTGETCLERSYL